MPLVKAYTFVADAVLDDAGMATIVHNLVYTTGALSTAVYEVTVTPTDATGVSVYVNLISVIQVRVQHTAGAGGAGGHVRVQIQVVHSVQQ